MMPERVLRYLCARVIRSLIVFAVGAMLILLPAAQAARGAGGASGIHEEVMHLGVGHKAKLVLKEGSREKGLITGIDDASFVLDRGAKGGVTTVSYDAVREIHRDGLSRGAKIGIGVGAASVVTVGVILLVLVSRIFKN